MHTFFRAGVFQFSTTKLRNMSSFATTLTNWRLSIRKILTLVVCKTALFRIRKAVAGQMSWLVALETHSRRRRIVLLSKTVDSQALFCNMSKSITRVACFRCRHWIYCSNRRSTWFLCCRRFCCQCLNGSVRCFESSQLQSTRPHPCYSVVLVIVSYAYSTIS